MLRALVAVLLAANVLFFAWARGWLAPALPPPHASEREPQRLQSQFEPERITVIAPPAASAAITAARDAAARCLQAGPFDDEAALSAAEAALAGLALPAGTWQRLVLPAPPAVPTYGVLLQRPPDAAARLTREAELRRLGLGFEALEPPADAQGRATLGAPAGAWVLSRHEDEATAAAALAQVVGKGLRGARIAALPVTPSRPWIRAEKAGTEAQAVLRALQSPALAGGFRDCDDLGSGKVAEPGAGSVGTGTGTGTGTGSIASAASAASASLPAR